MIRAIESATFPGVFLDWCQCDRCGDLHEAYITLHSAEAVIGAAVIRLAGRGWHMGRRQDGMPFQACPACAACLGRR